MVKRRKKQKTKVKRDYPAPEILLFTPGFKRLVRGVHCLIICPEYVSFEAVHMGIWCKIKACHKNVILIGVGKWYKQEYYVSPDYLAIPKKDGTISKQFYHNLIVRSLGKTDLPLKLITFMRKECDMGAGDRKKRSHSKKKKKLRKAKPRTPAERKTKALAVSSKRKKKPKKKRKSITQAMWVYFDRVGLKKITYEGAMKIAKSVKPDTKFNRAHFSWYRNRYRQLHGIE